MTTDNLFGSGSPFNDPFKRQREEADRIKRLLGPGYELQQRLEALDGPLASIRALQENGTLARLASLQTSGVLSTALAGASFHGDTIKALQERASPGWMLALQETARNITRQDAGSLATQKLLAAATGLDMTRLAGLFDANRSLIERATGGAKWAAQLRSFSERYAPSLEGIRIAAERARLLDMQMLRASADIVARSGVVIAAEQVLEAHRLIEAIGQASSQAQGITLFAQLLALIGALFEGFGENALKELRGIGAFRLIELVMMAIAIWHMAVPAEMSPPEQKAFAEMKAELESVEEKLDRIVAADRQANADYVAGLPRAELKRDAAIRSAPQGKAAALMHAHKGAELAVKESRGKWRRVAYRDLLTDQMSEGWVYAPAVQLLDPPAP